MEIAFTRAVVVSGAGDDTAAIVAVVVEVVDDLVDGAVFVDRPGRDAVSFVDAVISADVVKV